MLILHLISRIINMNSGERQNILLTSRRNRRPCDRKWTRGSDRAAQGLCSCANKDCLCGPVKQIKSEIWLIFVCGKTHNSCTRILLNDKSSLKKENHQEVVWLQNGWRRGGVVWGHSTELTWTAYLYTSAFIKATFYSTKTGFVF